MGKRHWLIVLPFLGILIYTVFVRNTGLQTYVTIQQQQQQQYQQQQEHTIQHPIATSTTSTDRQVTHSSSDTTTTTSGTTVSDDDPNKHNQTTNYNTKRNLKPAEMDLPIPVIVMGLPKAGTTTLSSYFQCGFAPEYQHRVSHYDCHERPNHIEHQIHGARKVCGRALTENIHANRPPFEGIDHFDVYGELDVFYDHRVFFPQIRQIDRIYNAYPNSTWILNLRNTTEWVNSLTRTGIREKIANSKGFHPSFFKTRGVSNPNGTIDDSEMMYFFEKQAEYVRKTARKYPSIHVVEVYIDKPSAGKVMEQSFGISRDCWGKKNVNRKQLRKCSNDCS